jgi:hypothetical protein
LRRRESAPDHGASPIVVIHARLCGVACGADSRAHLAERAIELRVDLVPNAGDADKRRAVGVQLHGDIARIARSEHSVDFCAKIGNHNGDRVVECKRDPRKGKRQEAEHAQHFGKQCKEQMAPTTAMSTSTSEMMPATH